MKAVEFCYWLQGYFEIMGEEKKNTAQLTPAQVECIQRHLGLVFKHEIDPSYGDNAHQEELNTIHFSGPQGPDNGTLYRC